jgi:hypothetical protein
MTNINLENKTKNELWNMLKFQQILFEKGLTSWENVQTIQKVFDSIK